MNDPSTYWLTVTNVGLGLVALACVAAVAIGVFQEIAERRRKAAAAGNLDRELSELVASFDDSHAFHIPGLGMTMADGGEEFKKNPKER